MPNFRIRSVTLRVLAESIGKIITIETTPGILYKGKLVSVERNMDCKLTNVTFTDTSGTESYLNNAYVRGRKIVIVILPDMPNNAPVFNSGGNNGNVGAGRGKSAILSAQGSSLFTYFLPSYCNYSIVSHYL